MVNTKGTIETKKTGNGVDTQVTIKQPHRRASAANGSRNVHVMTSPSELERHMLLDIGKQVEAMAFTLVGRMSASEAGELIEIAARLQKFRISA